MLGRRYQLGEELGRGISGAVYRGRDTLDGRLIAVKMFSAAPRFGIRLPQHLLAAAQALSHPNIAAVYAWGVSGGTPYVVMEYARGHDLRAYVRRGRLLPLATVLSLGARVAEALAYAHARGAAHGDVNPANIVFDPVGDSVKLVDFVLEEGARRAGATPAYSAPEQLCGMPATPASDQFSLGVTLYRLASGELPFTAASRPELAFAIANKPHRDVRTLEPALPAPFAALVDRALAKQPSARYAGAGELARAVRAVAASAHADPKVVL
jgi:eukaryotic-like serine/threonine-protein kinase